jgi:hypothetical protein
MEPKEEQQKPLPEWLKEILDYERCTAELKQMIEEVRDMPRLDKPIRAEIILKNRNTYPKRFARKK